MRCKPVAPLRAQVRLRRLGVFVSIVAVALAIMSAGAGARTTLSHHTNTAKHAFKGTVTFGATLPETGIYSPYGRYYVDAYKLWVKRMNAKGGLLGKKVKLILYDDKSDSATAVSLYEKLLTVDKVDFIVGGFPTPVLMPVLQVAERFHKVFVQGGANAASLIKQGHYKWTFTTLTPSTIWAKSFIHYIKSLSPAKRPQKVAIVQEVNPLMQDIASVVVPELRKMGIDVAENQTFSSDTQDFTSMIQRFKAEGIDGVIALPNIPAGESFVRTAAQQQFKPKFMYVAVGPTLPSWIQQLGSATNDVFSSTPYWWTLPKKTNKAFIRATRKAYGYTPTRESGMAYTVMQVLQEAIQGAKSFNQNKVRNYLRKHKFVTVSGKMRFNKYGLTTSKCYTVQIQNGKEFLVWPKGVAQKAPVYPAS